MQRPCGRTRVDPVNAGNRDMRGPSDMKGQWLGSVKGQGDMKGPRGYERAVWMRMDPVNAGNRGTEAAPTGNTRAAAEPEAQQGVRQGAEV